MAQALEALRDLPEASHLALLSPRFMLRHPYGKKSDPISAFTFEEFTPEEGLRGMLWGHPALLAASLLAAPTGSTLSIGARALYLKVGATSLPYVLRSLKYGGAVAKILVQRAVKAYLASEFYNRSAGKVELSTIATALPEREAAD